MAKILDLLNRLSGLDNLIGIDRGAHSLKIVIAKRTSHGFKLDGFLLENLSNIEEKGRGSFVRNKLFEFLRKSGISKAGVFFISSDNDTVFAKRYTLPFMPVRELKQALSWETKDTLPFPAAEAVFDFQIIAEKKSAEGKKRLDIIAMAVHRKAINEAVLLLEGTELSLENITIIPACLINVVNYLENSSFESKDSIAFLELGCRQSTLCIFKKKKLIFTRQLRIGSDDITNAMMAGVSTKAGAISLSRAQAEQIKIKVGIPQEGQKTIKVENQELESSRLASMMLPVLEKIAQEIRNSFIYMAAKLEEPKPKKMYLLGGGSFLKNINNFFKDHLDMNIENFSLKKDQPFFANISTDIEKTIPQIAPAIGAVVAEQSSINFLPFEFKKKKLEEAVRILLRMSIFAAFASLLLSYMLISFRQIDYKKRFNFMKRQQDVMFQLRQSKNEIIKTQSVLSAIKGRRIETVTIMQELSLRTPKDILFDNISYSYLNEEIKIEGIILASELIAPGILSEYIKTIENSPIFQSANLISSTQRTKDNTTTLEFTINCKLESPL